MPRTLSSSVNAPRDTPQILTFTNAAAGTIVSQDFPNTYAAGLLLVINLTAFTGTLTVTLQGRDHGSILAAQGTYYPLLVSPAIGATGATFMQLAPGIGAVANVSIPLFLPAQWRLSIVIGTGGGVTGTISATYLDVSRDA